MKKILVAIFMFSSIPFFGLAHDHSSLMHQSMKELGQISKQITATIQDPAQNFVNAQNVKRMGELLVISLNNINDIVHELPTEEQAAATQEMKAMLTDEINLAIQLEEAFLENDNESAQLLWQKMNSIKREGHDKYK